MKRGFELFKTRMPNEKINIAAFENKYDIYLPDLYKLFLETFHPKIQMEVALVNSKEKRNLYRFEHSFDDSFNEINEIFDIVYAFEAREDFLAESISVDNLFCIGSIDVNEVLCVGLIGENKDRIFCSSFGRTEFELISENIFGFIRGLSLVKRKGFYRNSEYFQLYKNWGEDFWRVREEKKKANI